MHKIKTVLQSEHSECGLAVASCILAYFDREVTLSELRERYGSPRGGISIGDIKTILNDRKVEFRGVRINDFSTLKQLDAPAILHWKHDHFIVYGGSFFGKHLVMDPSQGKDFIDDRELNSGFDGIALVFKRLTAEKSYCHEARRAIDPLNLRKLVQSNTLSLIAIVTCMIAVRLVMLFVPVASQAIVNGSFNASAMNIIFLLAIISLIHYCCSALSGYLLASLQISWSRQLTERLVKSILSRKYPFFINQSSGSLTYKVNLMSTIQQLISTNLIQNLISVVFSLIYFFMLFAFSPIICMVVSTVCIISSIISFVYSKWNLSMSRKVLNAGSDAQSAITETLGGIETVKALGAEQTFYNNWDNIFRNSTDLTFQQGKIGAIVGSITSSMLSLLPVIVLLAGIELLGNGSITVGALVACLSMSGYFSEPFSTLVQSAIQWATLKGMLEQVEDLLRHSDDSSATSERGELGKASRVELDAVSFTYSAFSSQALSNLTLSINSGEKVAIVGRSGSGKSTLLKLVSGLLEPTEGSVHYEFANGDRKSAINMRGKVAYLPQNPTVFGLRIEDNLMLGTSPLSLEKKKEILSITGVDEMLQSEKAGLNQLISEGGKNLSGGQIQRMAMARCLLLNPTTIVMDEPTSSLDAIAEKRIMDYLNESNMTVVISAHRLETISKMDKIYVIENGRIVENGSHEELLALGKQYAHLYESALTGRR